MTVATVLVAIATTGACSGDDDEGADDPTSPGWTATTLDRSPGDSEGDGAAADDSSTGDGSEGDDQITTTIVDPEGSPEQLVEATYEAYWDRREHAIKFPDVDDTSLAEVASGAALSELADTVAGLERVGQQGQFGALDSHHVYEVELGGATTATVSDCALSDARIVVAATGEVVRTDPPEGKSFIYTATLRHGDDGRWRVDDLSRVPLMGGQFCASDGPVGQGS